MTMIEFTGAGLAAGGICLFIVFIGVCFIPEIENTCVWITDRYREWRSKR